MSNETKVFLLICAVTIIPAMLSGLLGFSLALTMGPVAAAALTLLATCFFSVMGIIGAAVYAAKTFGGAA